MYDKYKQLKYINLSILLLNGDQNMLGLNGCIMLTKF
jgi:hypothetical protein